MNPVVTWDIASKWKNFHPPIRPSKDDLAVFEKYLQEKIKQKGKSLKLLILGSTPELRDLAKEHGIVPIVCDYSKENYDALGMLCKKEGKELFVNCDWRELHLPEPVDLVFCEASFNMVNKEDLRKVLSNAMKIISNNGLIVAKTWIRFATTELSFDALVQSYRKSYSDVPFLYAVPLLSFFYDEDQGSVQKRHQRMKRYEQEGKITKEEFSSMEHHGYDHSPHKIYLLFEEELIKILKEYFTLTNIEWPKQIGMNKAPIMVMGKKGL